ncbi:hypothetical protein DIPPA_29707 [Diplonema papillatum]|nr:hypothetical protein DIPPA_29707 [Diplonema papillatum]
MDYYPIYPIRPRFDSSSTTISGDDVDNRLELQMDVESVDDLDGATVRQVLRRARDRCYSRAVSALSAAQTAPADDATLAALMELHPPAPELPDDRSLRPVAVAKPSPGVIRRVLKKMPKGTAAGPSGLSAQHLLDLWDVSGSFKEAVADAVWALSSGRVAAAARPYLFGARLVPLVKKSGGIRPIACGEILRRVAGKVLASDRAIKDLGANVLLRSGQVGVSVKAGADAGVHAIRRVAALYRDRDVTDRGILQIDFANAFNMLRREAIIRSVNRHAPQLLGYALAAYEKHSALVVGDREISSECGVQQGDPLGPLLFSLALHDVVVPPSPEEQPPVPAALASSQVPADSASATPVRDSGQPEPAGAIGGQPTPPVPAQAPGSGDPAASPPPAGSSAARGAPEGALSQAELDLLTFFLDDGAAGGELDSLGRWLRDFEDRATAVGLRLNRGKCRLSVAPGATIPEALQGIETCPLDEIQHLGVPCGSPEKMRVFVEEAAKGAERKMRMIASLPDAHVALTLLKFCAGFVSVVHLMRAVGAVFDFAGIDQATQSCLATITGIETDASAWALASLPVRLGGLGLHSCADTAAIAHIAATFDGEACLSSLVTPYVLPHAMLLNEDDTFLASLEDPRLAPFDSVLEKIQDVLQARDNYGGRGQKVWSTTVHGERRKALLDSMTEELGRSGQLQGPALALKQVQIRARIQSCSGQHASAWLYGNAEADPRLWLSPAELAVAIRLRLGLPIAPMPSICRLCGTGSADVDGVHARSCFSGGRRTRMHNALRDVIADFARRGLLAPAVERPVFSNTERKRPDISYVRDGTTVVLDVAVTFPLQPSNPQYAKRAAEKPGGAATAYATAVKEGKYRGIIDNEPNPREWLAVPLVVDTFGAWCPGALTELRQIARKSALREDRTASAACQDFFHQLSFQGGQVPSAFHFRPDNGRLRPIIRLAGDAGASADAYLRSLLGALGGEEPPSGTAQWVLAWLACASAPTATPADFEELVRSVSPAHHEGPSPRLPGRSADAAHSDSADYAAFSAAAAAAAAHASSTAATSAAAAAADPSAASSSAAAPRTPSGIPLPGTPEGDEEVARALQVDVQDTPARRVTFAERPDDIRRLESQVERLTAMVLALVERSSPPAPQRPSVQRGMEVPPPPPLVDASRVPFGSHHAGAGHTPAPFSAPQPPAPVPAPTQPSQPAQENPFAGQHFSAPSQTEVFQQDPLDALERGSVQSQPALITPGPGLLDPRVWLSYGPVEKSLLLVHIRDIFAEVLNGSQALANDGQHLLHHLSCILHLMDDTSDQEGMVRLAESTLHRMVVLKTALKAGWSVAADLQKGYHEEDEVPAYLRRGFQAMRKADEQPAKPASPPSSGGRGTRRQQEERVSVSVLDRFPPPPRATSGGRALLLEPPLSNGERERLVGKANSYIGDALALSTRRGVHSVYRRFLEFRRHWETRFGTPLDVPTAVVLFVTRLLSREPNSISTSTAVQYVVNIQSAERRLGRPIESQLVRDFIRSLKRAGALRPAKQAVPATKEDVARAVRLETDPVMRLAITLAWQGAARVDDVLTREARNVTESPDFWSVNWVGSKSDPFRLGQVTGVVLPPEEDETLRSLLRSARPGQRIFAGVTFRRVVAALKRSNQALTGHSLRRGALFRLLKMGVDLDTLQRVSRHATQDALVRYLPEAEVPLVRETACASATLL